MPPDAKKHKHRIEPRTRIIRLTFPLLRAASSAPYGRASGHKVCWLSRFLDGDRVDSDDAAPLAPTDVKLSEKQDEADRQEGGADRPLDEYLEIATGEQHCATEIFFKPRPKHETEQDGRGM